MKKSILINLLLLATLALTGCGKKNKVGDVSNDSNNDNYGTGFSRYTNNSGVNASTGNFIGSLKSKYSCTFGRESDRCFSYSGGALTPTSCSGTSSSGKVSAGVDTFTKDLILVEQSGSSAFITLSLCNDQSNGYYIIGNGASLSNFYLPFGLQTNVSSNCPTDGVAGQVYFYSNKAGQLTSSFTAVQCN